MKHRQWQNDENNMSKSDVWWTMVLYVDVLGWIGMDKSPGGVRYRAPQNWKQIENKVGKTLNKSGKVRKRSKVGNILVKVRGKVGEGTKLGSLGIATPR